MPAPAKSSTHSAERRSSWAGRLVAGLAAVFLLMGAATWVRPELAAAGSGAASTTQPNLAASSATTVTTSAGAIVHAPPASADCAAWPGLEPTVAAHVSVDPSDIGIWVIDLTDRCSNGFNGSTEMAAASTIKLLALAGLLEAAQHDGRELTDNERGLATAMMQYSDNDAATELIDELESRGESFAALGARWGVPGAQNPSWGLSRVSAAEMAGLVAAMFDGSKLDERRQEEAKAFLDLPDADFSAGWRIAVGYGLPDGWYNGSKVGELVVEDRGLVLHGVGLVESPTGHRYAVAVLGSGWDGYDDEGTAIAELDAVGPACPASSPARIARPAWWAATEPPARPDSPAGRPTVPKWPLRSRRGCRPRRRSRAEA